jgi:hypothetical protein
MTDAPAPPVHAPRWYGWHIIVPWTVGMTELTVLTPVLAQHPNAPAERAVPVPGLIVMMASAPVVHLLHRRTRTALISAGINVGAPLALGFAGWGLMCKAVQNCNADFLGPFGATGGFLIGAGVGSLAAAATDDALLTYETAARGAPVQALMPTAYVASGRVVVGLGGTF